ncbi:hypothetical protein Tco_0241746 [Tanacetum coccineum]
MGNAIVKLVKKVKKLEGFLKRRNVVLSDSEEEEPEAQGRKSQDDPLASLVQGLVTPSMTKVNASEEEQVEDISPNTLEAAKTLSRVASLKPKSIDKGRRYKRRKETKGKKVVSSLVFQEEVDTGAKEITTCCRSLIMARIKLCTVVNKLVTGVLKEEVALLKQSDWDTLQKEEVAKNLKKISVKSSDQRTTKKMKDEEEGSDVVSEQDDSVSGYGMDGPEDEIEKPGRISSSGSTELILGSTKLSLAVLKLVLNSNSYLRDILGDILGKDIVSHIVDLDLFKLAIVLQRLIRSYTKDLQIFHRQSHKLSPEHLPLVEHYSRDMVSRRVLTLCIPSSFVVVIVVMVTVVGSWSAPLVQGLKSRYIPTSTTLANSSANRSTTSMYLIVPFSYSAFRRAFGGNTRSLGAPLGEEMGLDYRPTYKHRSRISTQKLKTASQITRDAVTTHLKTASQDLQTASECMTHAII